MAQQAGSANEIAEALIRLGVVGREQLTAELARARAEGQKFAGTMGGEVNRGSRQAAEGIAAATASSESFQKSAGRLQSAMGRLGAAFGVLMAFNTGRKLRAMFEEVAASNERTSRESQDFRQSLNDMDEAGAYKAAKKELEMKQSRLGDLESESMVVAQLRGGRIPFAPGMVPPVGRLLGFDQRDQVRAEAAELEREVRVQAARAQRAREEELMEEQTRQIKRGNQSY